MRNQLTLTPIAVAVLLAASSMSNAQTSGTGSTAAPSSPAARGDAAKNPNSLLPASPTGTPPTPRSSPSDASGGMRGGSTGDYETDQYGNRKETKRKGGSTPGPNEPRSAGTRAPENTSASDASGNSTLDKMKGTVDSTDRSMAATPGPTVTPRASDKPTTTNPSGNK